MNRYTLEFQVSKIEMKYQSKLNALYCTLYKWINATLIIAFSLGMIHSFIEYRYRNALMWILPLIYVILSQVLVMRVDYVSKYAITLTNLLLLLLEILNYHLDQSYSFYTATNHSIVIHTLIIVLLDFKISMINNALVVILKSCLVGLYNLEQKPTMIIVYAFSHFTLFAYSYHKSKQQREFFLISLKDKQWETILPQMMAKPLFIFSYDQESIKFLPHITITKSFLKEKRNPLEYFLRNAFHKGLNLESYILKKSRKYSLKDSSVNMIKPLKVKLNKQTRLIKFTEFVTEKQTFLITVEDEDENIKQLKAEQQVRQRKWLDLVIRFLDQQTKLLQKAIKVQNYMCLSKLLCSYEQMLLIYQLHKAQKLAEVNVNDMITGILEYFNSNKQFKFINKTQVTILTNSCQLKIYLLELFKKLRIDDRHPVLINVGIEQHQPYLVIEGSLKKFSSKLFEKLQSYLFENIDVQKTRVKFYFAKRPMEPFKLIHDA